MMAMWLVSLQCMHTVAARATYGCSLRHIRLQAEWLLSLVEDLERHSSACQVGCAPEEGRIALGGAIMAWQARLLVTSPLLWPYLLRRDHGAAGSHSKYTKA